MEEGREGGLQKSVSAISSAPWHFSFFGLLQHMGAFLKEV